MDWTKSIATEVQTGEIVIPDEPKEEDDFSSSVDEE